MSYTPENPNGQATSANSEPVVLASDQPGINSFLDKTVTATITALAGTVVVNSQGSSTVNLSVLGTWVGVLVFEAQCGDLNWIALAMINEASAGVVVSTTTVNGVWTAGSGGFVQCRVRASAFTSGTVNVTLNASAGSQQSLATDANGNQQIVGNVADGATDSGNSVKVGGVYDTTLPTYSNGQRGNIQLDSNGRVLVANTILDGSKATYSALGSDFTIAAAATDIFTISGSASKTIRILRFEVWATQTTAGEHDFQLYRRSTLDSGGTSTTLTATPHDSGSASATAVVKYYTTNPTSLGTLVGGIRAAKMFVPATGTGSAQVPLVWDFGDRPGQALVLRGTSENIALYADGTNLNGSSFYVSVEWTEE